MLVVPSDVNWSKQVGASPTSMLAKCFGVSMAPIEFIRNAHLAQQPAKWMPLPPGGRATTFKIYVSQSCRNKHQLFTSELTWLSGLGPSSMHGSRYRFELIEGDDISVFLNRLKGCNTMAQTKPYKCLVCKDEKDVATNAVASTLSVQPNQVKMVTTFSAFIVELGKLRQS